MAEYKSMKDAKKIVEGWRGIVNYLFFPKKCQEAEEVINRCYEAAIFALEHIRNPNMDSMGKYIETKLALAQSAPNLEIGSAVGDILEEVASTRVAPNLGIRLEKSIEDKLDMKMQNTFYYIITGKERGQHQSQFS